MKIAYHDHLIIYPHTQSTNFELSHSIVYLWSLFMQNQECMVL